MEVAVFLFGKPAWEIEDFEGGELDDRMIEQIREKGKELNHSLDQAADVLRKLLQNGWNGNGTLYDVSLFKDVPLEEARRELVKLGLDPDLANELDDDDDTESPETIER